MGIAIKMKEISKLYESNEVLKDFNLEIKEGEMVALVGKSGAGKSTLLSIMGLIENFDSGVLEFFGKPAPKIGGKENTLLLRNTISFLFQNNALIENESIGKNFDISLAYRKLSKKEKEDLKLEVLSKVGLNYPLNQKIYKLSGGEQQRVAIAKLMLKETKVILADEPTGALDAENASKVMRLIRELKNMGKTVVIVTHDLDIADSCDRVIYIKDLKENLENNQVL